jgi:hypothetical protein
MGIPSIGASKRNNSGKLAKQAKYLRELEMLEERN